MRLVSPESEKSNLERYGIKVFSGFAADVKVGEGGLENNLSRDAVLKKIHEFGIEDVEDTTITTDPHLEVFLQTQQVKGTLH